MTASDTTVISVLIAARDAAATIGEQLDALVDQSFTAPWEIIVVDDGSSDATASIIDARATVTPWIRRVAGPARGVAAARNAALDAARAPYLAMVDADDVVAPGWLAAMAAALDDAPIVAGALDIDALNPEWVRGTRGRGISAGPGSFAGLVSFANSCNLGVRREVVDRIGGFDESLTAGEDIEFSHRAALAGFDVVYADAAVVRYRYRTTLGGLWRQAVAYGRSRTTLEARLRGSGLVVPDPSLGRSWLGLVRRSPQAFSRAGRANLVFAAGGLWGRSREAA